VDLLLQFLYARITNALQLPNVLNLNDLPIILLLDNQKYLKKSIFPFVIKKKEKITIAVTLSIVISKSNIPKPIKNF